MKNTNDYKRPVCKCGKDMRRTRVIGRNGEVVAFYSCPYCRNNITRKEQLEVNGRR